MINRDRIGLPVGALAAAFLTVLLLGTVYNAFQPPTAIQVLPPPTQAPTPAASATPTTTTPTTTFTPTGTTAVTAAPNATPSTASTATHAVKPVPNAGASHRTVTLNLLGDPFLETVIRQGLMVSVGDQNPILVTTKTTPLTTDGPLTTLCFTTSTKVHFSIATDATKAAATAQKNCFDFGKDTENSVLDVTVNPG